MSSIKFIEQSHQYLTEDGDELVSVSAFTKRFQKKIDWKAIARKSAAKKTKEGEPTTAKELLDKWERKRDKAAQIGVAYHAAREKELVDTQSHIFYNAPCEVQQCSYTEGEKWSIPINQLSPDTIYPELMIYDTDYMICGQADKVIVTDNRIHVWDYKTDTEIKFKAFSSGWIKPQKLLPPLSHLDDANGNIYSIKMSLYMYLLWKANQGQFRPGDLIIEHIHLKRDPNNDNLPVLVDGKPVVQKTEKITLPYRKKEVEAMLATIKPII